jgi:hypothetical protein
MKRIPILLILALLFLLLSPPVASMAASPGSSATLQGGGLGDNPVGVQDLAAPQGVTAIGPDTLFWRTGVDMLVFPVSYASQAMRSPAAISRFRSSVATTAEESYFVLGAASRPLRVAYGKVYLLSRSGSYGGSVAVSLYAATMSGYGAHPVSNVILDLEALPVGSWQTFNLTVEPAFHLLAPGETLLVYYDLDGASGGSLDVRLLFEVALTTHTTEIYLPMIRYTTMYSE